MEKLHSKHALPGFTDRSAEEREIEAMTADITRVGCCAFMRPSFPELNTLCGWTGFSKDSFLVDKGQASI